MEGYATLIALLAFTYIFNIPFGYWRANTRKFSLGWIAAIHLPVPLIFGLRVLFGVGLELIPIFVFFYFLGQFTGGRIRRRLAERYGGILSSCLVIDLYRISSVEKM